MSARIIAFYSFKGGVGRTLTMVNVGWKLAQCGFEVLLVDGDLEAPGLSSFPLFANYSNQKGFLHVLDTYVKQYTRLGWDRDSAVAVHPDSLVVPEADLPIMEDYWHDVPLDRSANSGRLRILLAGSDDKDYTGKLQDLGLSKFREKRTANDMLMGLRKTLSDCTADFVLLDTRTGYSDLGEFSLFGLADDVVLVSNLSTQSRKGTADVARQLARKCEFDGRPERILLVASLVPTETTLPQLYFEERAVLLEKLRRDTGLPATTILPLMPPLFLAEQVYVDENPRWELSDKLAQLAKKIAETTTEDRVGAARSLLQNSQLDEFANAIVPLCSHEPGHAVELLIEALRSTDPFRLATVPAILEKLSNAAVRSGVAGWDSVLEVGILLSVVRAFGPNEAVKLAESSGTFERLFKIDDIESVPEILTPYTTPSRLLPHLLGSLVPRMQQETFHREDRRPWTARQLVIYRNVVQRMMYEALRHLSTKASSEPRREVQALADRAWATFIKDERKCLERLGDEGSFGLANLHGLRGRSDEARECYDNALDLCEPSFESQLNDADFIQSFHLNPLSQ